MYNNPIVEEIVEEFKEFSKPLWFDNTNGEVFNENNETHQVFGAINVEYIEPNAEYSYSSMEKDKYSLVANVMISLSCFEDPFLQVHPNPLLKEITFDQYLDYGIPNGKVKFFRKSKYGIFSWYSYAFGLANDPLMVRELMNCVFVLMLVIIVFSWMMSCLDI